MTASEGSLNLVGNASASLSNFKPQAKMATDSDRSSKNSNNSISSGRIVVNRCEDMNAILGF